VGGTFVYAGDSQADVPIWKAAQAAVLVDLSKTRAEALRRDLVIEREFQQMPRGGAWLHALRVHQWLKNLLLFVPMLTAFSFFEVSNLISMLVAFISFSFLASATYIFNDLWDLENDRGHPRKRFRPFASGRLPILNGVIVATCVLILGLALSLTLSKGFFLVLLLYLVMTSAYSWVLKEYVLIDVLMLSLLYTLRILAGSVAIGVINPAINYP